MTTIKKSFNSKYMAGDIRNSIYQAIQNELANLPTTLTEIKDPVQRLNYLTKLMPFVCAPIKQVEVMTARVETGEDTGIFDDFSLFGR